MEIDYLFPRGLFSYKKSARVKILTELKTALSKITKLNNSTWLWILSILLVGSQYFLEAIKQHFVKNTYFP